MTQNKRTIKIPVYDASSTTIKNTSHIFLIDVRILDRNHKPLGWNINLKANGTSSNEKNSFFLKLKGIGSNNKKTPLIVIMTIPDDAKEGLYFAKLTMVPTTDKKRPMTRFSKEFYYPFIYKAKGNNNVYNLTQEEEDIIRAVRKQGPTITQHIADIDKLWSLLAKATSDYQKAQTSNARYAIAAAVRGLPEKMHIPEADFHKFREHIKSHIDKFERLLKVDLSKEEPTLEALRKRLENELVGFESMDGYNELKQRIEYLINLAKQRNLYLKGVVENLKNVHSEKSSNALLDVCDTLIKEIEDKLKDKDAVGHESKQTSDFISQKFRMLSDNLSNMKATLEKAKQRLDKADQLTRQLNFEQNYKDVEQKVSHFTEAKNELKPA